MKYIRAPLTIYKVMVLVNTSINLFARACIHLHGHAWIPRAEVWTYSTNSLLYVLVDDFLYHYCPESGVPGDEMRDETSSSPAAIHRYST